MVHDVLLTGERKGFDRMSLPIMHIEGAAAWTPVALIDRLAGLFTPADLDRVIDRAARACKCVVAVFAAAPAHCWNEHCAGGECVAVEWAVEFLVPPASLETFHRELEAQLLRASQAYVVGRSRGLFAPCILRNVPGGTFHQHRVAAKCDGPMTDADHRWSADHGYVGAVLHQARIGWHEID